MEDAKEKKIKTPQENKRTPKKKKKKEKTKERARRKRKKQKENKRKKKKIYQTHGTLFVLRTGTILGEGGHPKRKLIMGPKVDS